MKYISKVKSSLKKGCDVTLGPRTVLVGANGSGKSTVVQSLELAARGWVTDMEGREKVKQGKALSRLFSDHSSMFSHAVLSDTSSDDEVNLKWSMKAGSRGGFKTPKHEPPVILRFPVQDISATLSGDATTVGAWLEGQVLDELSTEDVLSQLPPAVRDDARAFIERQPKADFMSLAKEAKRESSGLRRKATSTEKTIDSMVEGIAPPMTQAKLDELQKRWEELEKEANQITVTQADYDALQQAIKQQQAQVDVKAGALRSLHPPDKEAEQAAAKVAQLKHFIKVHVQHYGMSECKVCGNPDAESGITARVNTIHEVEQSLLGTIKANQRRQAMEEELQQLRNELQNMQAKLQCLVVSDADPSAEARQILDRISQDKANRRAWTNADAQRKEVAQMRARADRISLVGKELAKAGKALLQKRQSEFEQQVSAFLPGEEELGVDLSTARLGLQREGDLHSALSGAEESRVLLALAAAQEDGSTPCVLIPKDRGWDSATLTSVMKALADSPVQVIIMSTVEPDPVEGWSLVAV